MMIEQDDLRINVIRKNFVKIKHVTSGITVTKENKSQVKAKEEALEELEMLVELWESEGE